MQLAVFEHLPPLLLPIALKVYREYSRALLRPSVLFRVREIPLAIAQDEIVLYLLQLLHVLYIHSLDIHLPSALHHLRRGTPLYPQQVHHLLLANLQVTHLQNVRSARLLPQPSSQVAHRPRNHSLRVLTLAPAHSIRLARTRLPATEKGTGIAPYKIFQERLNVTLEYLLLRSMPVQSRNIKVLQTVRRSHRDSVVLGTHALLVRTHLLLQKRPNSNPHYNMLFLRHYNRSH